MTDTNIIPARPVEINNWSVQKIIDSINCLLNKKFTGSPVTINYGEIADMFHFRYSYNHSTNDITKIMNQPNIIKALNSFQEYDWIIDIQNHSYTFTDARRV